MAYFSYFPVTSYNLSKNNDVKKYNLVTNILLRVKKKLEITNAAVFEQHFIQDGDRADTLAYEYYNDSSLHWIIMYSNYMTNPYYDWPMTYFDLQKYVAKKYDDVNGIHHYIDEDGYEVDSTTANATAITNFVYEEAKNDESRSINIPKVIYTQQIINELKDIM